MEKEIISPEGSRQIGWALFDFAVAVGDIEGARSISAQLYEPMPRERITLMVDLRHARDLATQKYLERRILRIPVIEPVVSIPTR